MIKRAAETSISEDDEVSQVGIENGSRPEDDKNKSGKKRFKTKSLYRQPTVNELNRLQETENLFNSNLFRLQVEEILQEVKVKEKTEKKFSKWFKDFKTHLLLIQEDESEYDLSENTLAKTKVKLPLSKDLNNVKCVFKFHKFDDIQIVGSYATGTAINSELHIDLQITVPAETYTKNDSINYRYHKKRAAYLTYLAAHLQKLKTIELLNYTTLHGLECKPFIDIKPADNLAKHFTIRLNLVCEPDAYKLHRFSPQRNNLRESYVLGDKTENKTENSSDIGPPTPFYNSSVLSDLTAEENNHYLRDTLQNADNLKQAIVLLKIWLRQRKLDVSGHVISMYVAYLVQAKRINNIMSSYQIVRNVWIALKTSEWDTKGISLHKDTNSPPLEEFQKHFPVVFLDTTGYYNLVWNMCLGTYNALKRESMLAVEMLDNGNINSFIPLFMVPVTPLMQFDHIIRFKNFPKLKEAILARAPSKMRINYGLDYLSLVTNTLHSLLTKGLGNRAVLILPIVEADFTWSSIKKLMHRAKFEAGYQESLSFGVILNGEHAMNVVEKGPPANVPEAEEFRLFWGDKSELRRFQDGSITETCVWEAETNCEQRAITKQIVDYLLQLKYEIPPSEIYHTCGYLDSLLYRKQYVVECEEVAERTTQAFDELRRDLRALTHLPLEIAAVYGTSPVFSYSDPVGPLVSRKPHSAWRRGDAALIKDMSTTDGCPRIPQYTPVCNAVVELGHSGKWPGDLEAFRCLKAAFHLQIADRLRQQFSLPSQPYPSHVDVLKNGLVFRLEVVHPKEITLLRREMENGVVKYREREESVALQRDKVLLPRVRGALHGLNQKHSAYGPTACLFKRWLASHLLSPPHWPDTLADLLSAAVFLLSWPLSPPANPATGLLRVLRLLAETDWTTDMVLLDFNGDMKREEITELESKFKERDVSSQPMFVATSYDGDLPAIWSAHSPTPQVLARAQVLAQSTVKFMEQALMKDMRENVLSLFVPPLSGYDALIRLDPRYVPHSAERIDHKPSPKCVPTELADDVIPIVEFDPVRRYLEVLRSVYDEFALFFHDRYGGDVIAVLWKPRIEELRDLQITSANGLKPVTVSGEKKYKVNIAALIDDFRILGDGIVTDITVNN